MGRDVLKHGLGWVVSNGKDMSVWSDPWQSCDQSLKPIGPAPEGGHFLKVSDLLYPLTNTRHIEKI